MALQDKEKEAVIFYLGWPAKTLVVDSTHYSKIISDRLTNLAEVTEKKVKAILAKLEGLDTNLEEAQCRLTAVKVADVQMDTRTEIEMLRSERRRCIRELGKYLDIPNYHGGNLGNVCI